MEISKKLISCFASLFLFLVSLFLVPSALAVNTILNQTVNTDLDISTLPTANGIYLHSRQAASPAGLYLDTSNNVGIGTTSPGAILNVSATNAGEVRLNVGGNDFGLVSVKNLNSNGYFGVEGNIGGNIFPGTNARAIVLGGTHGSGDLQFATNNTVQATIKAGGNVGIGTTAPAQRLHVYGTAGNLLSSVQNTNAAGYSGLQLYNDVDQSYLLYGGSTYTGYAGNKSLNIIGGGGPIAFFNTATEAMRITAAGNVGIGNSGSIVPVGGRVSTETLTVSKSPDGNPGVVVYGQTLAQDGLVGYGIANENNDGATAGMIAQIRGANKTINGYNGQYLRFDVGKTPTEVMRLTNDNQGGIAVGIGTTSPGQKLSVAGTIESTSGGFKFPDGTTQLSAVGGSATISSGNVSSGAFGSNTGGGNYSFPASVGIGAVPAGGVALDVVGKIRAGTLQLQGGSDATYSDYTLNAGGGSKEFNIYNQLSNKYALFVTGGAGNDGWGNTNVGINNTTPGYAKLRVLQDDATASQTRYAVRGEALGAGSSSTNIGGYFSASGATNNYSAIFDQGNVGIGTTSPESLLTVAGVININNGGMLRTNGAATNVQWGENYKVSTNQLWDSSKGSWITQLGPSNVNFYHANATAGSPSYSSLFTVTDTGDVINSGVLTSSGSGNSSFVGNVGIGTTSPASKLHVATGSSTAAISLTTTAAPSGLQLMTGYGSGADTRVAIIQRENADLLLRNDATTAGIAFLTNGGNERMRIDQNGNVGIGTTSPGVALEVKPSAIDSNVAALRLTSSDGGFTAGQELQLDFNQLGTMVSRISMAYFNPDWGFNFYGNGTATSPIVTMRGSGNVGIGTTSPLGVLHMVSSANSGNGYFAYLDHYGTATGADSGLIIRAAQGTAASPSAIANTNIAGRIMMNGYDGTQFVRTGIIQSVVSGAVSTNNVPADLQFYTNSGSSDVTERMRITKAGRVLVGLSQDAFQSGYEATLQVRNTQGQAIQAITSSNDVYAGDVIQVAKTRGSIGSFSRVQNGDSVGALGFWADDGTSFRPGARIESFVDAPTSNGNNPAQRLVFSTGANGNSVPTERMRITSAGNIGIGTTSPAALNGTFGKVVEIDDLTNPALLIRNTTASTGKQWSIYSGSNGGLYFYDASAGANRMNIDTSGNVVAQSNLSVQGNLTVTGTCSGCGGATSKSQTYLTSGTYSWTAPAGVTLAYISLVAGGGGGSSGYSGNCDFGGSGGGGGAGESVAHYPVSVTPGTAYTIIVGSGGAGGPNASCATGSSGNSSNFGGTQCSNAIICVNGGSGGSKGANGNTTGVFGAGGGLGGGSTASAACSSEGFYAMGGGAGGNGQGGNGGNCAQTPGGTAGTAYGGYGGGAGGGGSAANIIPGGSAGTNGGGGGGGTASSVAGSGGGGGSSGTGGNNAGTNGGNGGTGGGGGGGGTTVGGGNGGAGGALIEWVGP